MFKIIWNGRDGITRYHTERAAWRAVHELLEEAFGLDDDDSAAYLAALAEHDVVPI